MGHNHAEIIETKRANAGRPLPPCTTCGQEIDRSRDRQVVRTYRNRTQYRHVTCATRIGLIETEAA
jgi:hypothetical protein